jgi:hypothetical protein
MFCEMVGSLRFVQETLSPERTAKDRALLAEVWHLIERDGTCSLQTFRDMVWGFMGLSQEEEGRSELKLIRD